jgi:hypothetical protein
MTEAAIDAGTETAPRTITISRRWAIVGTVATALAIGALAIALILSGGDSEGHPAFGPGGPDFSGMPEQTQGMQAPPSGSGIPPMPQGVTPSMPTDPTPDTGSSRGSGPSK